jgi:hypothetical protein
MKKKATITILMLSALIFSLIVSINTVSKTMGNHLYIPYVYSVFFGNPGEPNSPGLTRSADSVLALTGGSLSFPDAGTGLLLIPTTTNCTSSAAPAVCAAAPAGSVVVAAAATTVTVNTTAVTASSQILLTEDSSLGTKLSVTCNTTTGRTYTVTTRTAATSFVITSSAAPTTDPACLSYTVLN